MAGEGSGERRAPKITANNSSTVGTTPATQRMACRTLTLGFGSGRFWRRSTTSGSTASITSARTMSAIRRTVSKEPSSVRSMMRFTEIRPSTSAKTGSADSTSNGSSEPRSRSPATGVTFCVRGVISPLLSNIFLHLVFDVWMRETYPRVQFERYADDLLVHCRSKAEAEKLQQAVVARLTRCKLAVHFIELHAGNRVSSHTGRFVAPFGRLDGRSHMS